MEGLFNHIGYFLTIEKTFCFINERSLLFMPHKYIVAEINNNSITLFSRIDKNIFPMENMFARTIVAGITRQQIKLIGKMTSFRYTLIDIASCFLATNNLATCAIVYIMIRITIVDHAGAPINRKIEAKGIKLKVMIPTSI